LYKDNVIIDSIVLNENNQFFKHYDSLAPGLYTFKNEPESQHIYFEKNDSLVFTLDARNFDQTLVFDGRGSLKNNFLTELDIKNQIYTDFLFKNYDKPYDKFTQLVDSIHKQNKLYYNNRKQAINWSEEFDIFAQSYINYNHYVSFELYPYIHYRRTGKDITKTLPKNYYNYRNNLNINDERLISFQPFISYLISMINNIVYEDCLNETDLSDISLHCSIEKLKITNQIFESEKIKNMIFNKVALLYLLKDQNLENNKTFLELYFKLSTDSKEHTEIVKIYQQTQLLKPGLFFPDEILLDSNGDKVSLKSLIKSPTVIYFWSNRTPAYIEITQEKVEEFKKKYPTYKFIAVNIDHSHINWKKFIEKYSPEDITDYYQNSNYKNSRDKWLIYKIQRTIILNANGTIKDAFANIVDANFEEHL
jgi:peroxiredoxin